MQRTVRVNYESPNPMLYKFTANIQAVDNGLTTSQSVSLDEKNIMLRGCVMKNTKWVYAVVLYTGHETKIMLNTHTPDIKQSSVEKKMSKYIILVCCAQFAICFLAAIYYAIW